MPISRQGLAIFRPQKNHIIPNNSPEGRNCVCVCIYIYTYTHTHTHTLVRTYVRVCVCMHSNDREHGFPTRLFSWCRVQRTRSVGTRCLVTANDSRDNSISYNSFTWSPSGRGAKRCWQQDRPGFLPSKLRREAAVKVPCAHGLNWGKAVKVTGLLTFQWQTCIITLNINLCWSLSTFSAASFKFLFFPQLLMKICTRDCGKSIIS